MLQLYDPNENLTAISAQMDLETAEKLQRELADIIAKKRQTPSYQHRSQLYDPSLIPIGEVKGVAARSGDRSSPRVNKRVAVRVSPDSVGRSSLVWRRATDTMRLAGCGFSR